MHASKSLTQFKFVGRPMISGEHHIFMDWDYHSELFNSNNYRTIDSILSVYPKYKVTVLLIGPTMLNFYKWGGELR
jgi:hypothetical protein